MSFDRRLPQSIAIARLLFGLLLLAPWPVAAQSSSGGGTIQGVVKDSSGAVVHSAKVTITHMETGVTTATASNEAGRFATPSLPIGSYRVRVESAGMSAWAGELVLRVGQIAEVSPVLSPGSVSETVVVRDAAPLVATSDATEASTLDSRRIAELPTDGRDMAVLLQDTTPGMEYGLDDYMPDSLRTAGMPLHATSYTQDGAVSNHRELGGGGNLQGLESIGELRVETSTSSARYSAPASVIISTKSGTNRLHGTLYETARNNAFGVARAREDVNPDGTPYQLPKLIRNEFGGSIGGPVVLPAFGRNGQRLYDGRNRTFFFFSREQRETRQGVTMEWSTPTAAMREGDFSGAVDGQGRRYTIYDPLTTRQTTTAAGQTVAVRDPFPGNRMSIARISPLAKRLYAITPLPTDITNPLVTANLRRAVATATYSNMSYNPATVRVDHRFGDRDNVFVKMNGGTQLYDGLGWNANTGAPTLGNEANYTYAITKSIAAAVSWTHLFSPSLFVETLASRMWLRTSLATGPVDRDWARELGLPNPFGGVGWPSITGVNFMNYIEGDARRYIRSNIFALQQNYSWLRGNHNVQSGFSVQNDLENLKPDAGVISGSTVFSNLPTALQNASVSSTASPTAVALTGLGAASLFLGYANSYAVRQHRPLMRTAQNQYALYLQDSYRVTPRLTLIPGLRWDMNPALTEKNHLLTGFDVATHAIVLPEPLEHYYRIGASNPRTVAIYNSIGVKFTTAADVGRDPGMLPSGWRDIGPRMGFAYRLSGGRRQVVLRGGYGLYFTARPMRTLLNGTSALPFQTDYSYNPNNAAQSPDGIANYTLRSAPAVVAGANSADVVDLSNPQAIGRGVAVSQVGHLPTPRVHEWNLSLERELSASTVVRIRYNGRHGANFDQFQNINPTPTDYVWYTSTGQPLPTGAFAAVARRPYDQTAYTNVNILQAFGFFNSTLLTAEIERRFSRGLGFQAFYTLSNALGASVANVSTPSAASVPEAYLPGSVPTDHRELNRFLNYRRDTAIPKHRVRWNWSYELPVGKGRRFAGGLPRALDAAIGGWKLAGTGNILSTWFALPANNWGEAGDFKVYGKQHPILDCRSTPASASDSRDERCIPGYLWFNGYISERYIDSRNAAGLRNGVFGLPADYQPAQKPVNAWPKNGRTGDPGSANWDTNLVILRLRNGSTVQTNPDTGLHPWRNQFRMGPFNWVLNSSLLKTFSFRERVRLRIGADLFNVFNRQGFNRPGSDGIVSLDTSYNGVGYRPRQLQVGGRVEW